MKRMAVTSGWPVHLRRPTMKKTVVTSGSRVRLHLPMMKRTVATSGLRPFFLNLLCNNYPLTQLLGYSGVGS